jgi:hypothetical protein
MTQPDAFDIARARYLAAHPELSPSAVKATVGDVIAESVAAESSSVIEVEIRTRGLDLPETDAEQRVLLTKIYIQERRERMT